MAILNVRGFALVLSVSAICGFIWQTPICATSVTCAFPLRTARHTANSSIHDTALIFHTLSNYCSEIAPQPTFVEEETLEQNRAEMKRVLSTYETLVQQFAKDLRDRQAGREIEASRLQNLTNELHYASECISAPPPVTTAAPPSTSTHSDVTITPSTSTHSDVTITPSTSTHSDETIRNALNLCILRGAADALLRMLEYVEGH
ncbi:uncharacterized protein LOC143292162 [Babylonia areolata]|uniref:uncharacterized protein LOC143292162 n=1 Tax=Babylonia areolata TaxID=304850 RepID=UPI003FD3ACBF